MQMMRANSTCRLTNVSAEEPRIQAAIAGRRDAAESLLADLLPRVRSLVRYSVHGDSEVDDIIQEAMIAILRGLPTYRGEGAFASWANRVVVRVTFAASKRARAERCQVDDDSAELAAMPSEEALPDDCLLHREVVELLEHLSDEQRRALLLHYVMGMSIPEMAEALEVPFETVRSRLRTGKAHLREMLFRES